MENFCKGGEIMEENQEIQKKQNWFMRHKIITGVLTVIIVLIILGAFAGGTGTDTTNTAGTSSEKSASNSPTVAEQKDLTPKVSDVTKLGDREFIVNSVKRSGAFGYNTPKAGKEYVIVNVTIRNLGSDEISYNPFDFKVQDANGAQENETFASLDDSLSSGTLAPGGKVTGSMPFEVPIGDKALLIFQPSFWSSQRVVVDLGSE